MTAVDRYGARHRLRTVPCRQSGGSTAPASPDRRLSAPLPPCPPSKPHRHTPAALKFDLTSNFERRGPSGPSPLPLRRCVPVGVGGSYRKVAPDKPLTGSAGSHLTSASAGRQAHPTPLRAPCEGAARLRAGNPAHRRPALWGRPQTALEGPHGPPKTPHPMPGPPSLEPRRKTGQPFYIKRLDRFPPRYSGRGGGRSADRLAPPQRRWPALGDLTRPGRASPPGAAGARSVLPRVGTGPGAGRAVEDRYRALVPSASSLSLIHI